jgi:hypothetical protein
MLSQYLLYLVVAALIIFGLFSLFKAFMMKRKINTGLLWPLTDGKVASSEVKYSSSGKGGRHYYAAIAYTYHLLGEEYAGKFSLDSLMGGKSAAEASAAAHPVGSTLSVHYNPEKPQECVTEYDKVNMPQLVGALVSLGVGCWFLWRIIEGSFP